MKSFQLIFIVYLFYQLPFELDEYRANVDDIKDIMKEKYGFEDPIILDQRYQEVLDDVWTRGNDITLLLYR